MTVTEDIKALLGAERGGVRLGAGLITLATQYLVDVAKVEDVNEIEAKDLKDAIYQAWEASNPGEKLPLLHERKVVAWTRGGMSLPMSSARSVDGGMPGLGDIEDDCEEALLFGVSDPSARDIAMLEADKLAQGLSGTRILILSAALELGRVPSSGEVLGKLGYKGDPRLSDLAKQQRKAGMGTLSKILDSGSGLRRELQSHFGGLIRDYTEAKRIEEASSITQWWSETQTVSGDDAVLASYIKEWLRKYPGRGIPETLDVILATRVTGQKGIGGVTAEQLKEVKEMAKAAKAEVGALKREVAGLRSQLGGEKGQGAGTNKGPKCHACGEFGHIARNCPKAKADAREEAGEKEE